MGDCSEVDNKLSEATLDAIPEEIKLFLGHDTEGNSIYSFDKRAYLEAFTQIGIPLDIEKQSNQKETIEFKVFKLLMVLKKEIQTILKKNSTSIEDSDARALVSCMRLNLAQIGDDPFVQSVNIFINKLSKMDRSLLSRMATDDDADPFSQNKNYIGYFFSLE
ncbi:hypothetical protein ACTFIR_007511 [Dictyostelium discoideum]